MRKQLPKTDQKLPLNTKPKSTPVSNLGFVFGLIFFIIFTVLHQGSLLRTMYHNVYKLLHFFHPISSQFSK